MTADQRLTLAEVSADRTCLSRAVQLPAGDRAQLRLLEPTDGDRFGHFLRELSEATRSLYAPHPLTLDFGRQLCCELDYAGLSDPSDPATLRFIGLVAAAGDAAPQQVVAYFILYLGVGDSTIVRYLDHGVRLDESATCTFAPVVADAYQDKGVGSALVPGVFGAARRLGFVQCVLMGGTRAINHRAIRYYEKAGFRQVGDFTTHTADGTALENHDMVMDL